MSGLGTAIPLGIEPRKNELRRGLDICWTSYSCILLLDQCSKWQWLKRYHITIYKRLVANTNDMFNVVSYNSIITHEHVTYIGKLSPPSWRYQLEGSVLSKRGCDIMHDIMHDITSQKILPTACALAHMCYKAVELPKISPKAHYNNNRLTMHMFWVMKRQSWWILPRPITNQ